MMGWDDVLGRQQDNLATLRYELAKLCEGSEDYRECRTVFDVCRKTLELYGEEI